MKKLLVWDGDDSLWNGTLLAGDRVTITPDRVELVKELRDRGVLQSIASHNTPENVMTVLHKYGIQDCFLSIQAGLAVPKSIMIKIIMEELNLVRQDDVVFCDDQPFNYNEVCKAFPGVTCIYPSQIPMAVLRFFTKESYTLEDRNRVLRYRSEESRKRASVEYKGSYIEFLRTCEMKARVAVPTEDEMKRVIDLVDRANRLSIMSDTVTVEELTNNKEKITACWCEDKFGDNGLIGLIFADKNIISAFVVSCTMQNKGIGSFLLGSYLNQHIGERVTTGWKPTEYNSSMLPLLQFFGFERMNEFNELLKEGVELYRIEKVSKANLPDWIQPL